MSLSTPNLDTGELHKFGALADDWWDPRGASRTLHHINPCRASYIAARTTLTGKRVLDVGCGGGILTESLARAGAVVTGIDLSPELIEVAKRHAMDEGLAIDYRVYAADALAADAPASFDCVVSMELLEHVPAPSELIGTLARLLRPSGDLFLSTLNRSWQAYASAIVGAEYLLRLLPIGTHDYQRFIRPSELAAMLREHDLALQDLAGMRYDPLSQRATLTTRPTVNFLLHATQE